MKTYFLIVTAIFAAAVSLPAQEKGEVAPSPRKGIDLTGYRTVADVIKADPKLVKPAPAANKPAGYLGLEFGMGVQVGNGGKVVIEAVDVDSPAEKAGLKTGDVVSKIGTLTVDSGKAARDALRGHFAGDALTVTVIRDGKPVDVTATLRAVSRPLTPSTVRLGLGIRLSAREDALGEVMLVPEGSSAAKAGIKLEDVILKVDGKPLEPNMPLADMFSDKKLGDTVAVVFKRGTKEEEVRVALSEELPGGFGGRGGDPGQGGRGGAGGPGGGRGGFGGRGATGWDDRLPNAWTRKTYKLAVIGVEYADVKHNPKIADKDWENSLFSIGTYKGKSATGQTVYGSMNDYYQEISYGTFKVDGKFVGWVELPKKRMEYSTGTGSSNNEKANYFNDVLDKVLATKGKDALNGYDGLFVLFAGGRTGNTRGSLYWPHRSSIRHRATDKSWPYFIVNELTGQGNADMTNISVFCHEFGHMIGLPDLYAKPEVPGMEGVGVWCAMSQQSAGGRPQHFSAWSKEQLNWIKPVVVDPRVKQKVVLSPIEDDPTQCVKVIVRTDGSEYYLLENRRKKGFDASLPADGLLIWRVLPGGGRERQPVFLEESHGIEGSAGPRSNPSSVPFPSPSNASFTPYTTPNSASKIGGGLDVFITNIRRLPDGRVTFHIGYEFQ
jgi:M6 family metalloprotease-like protein